MKRIIEFELQDSPKIAAEIDFKGEVIRADDEALKKEYDSGYNDGYALGDHEGFERGYGEGVIEGALPTYYLTTLVKTYQDVVFPEGTELTIRMKQCASCDAAFRLSKNLRSATLIVETEGVGSWSQLFQQSSQLELVDISRFAIKPTNIQYAFQATSVKKIIGALDLSSCITTAAMFDKNAPIEDIEFVPETIKVNIDFSRCAFLTADSINSILNGLADLTGSTQQQVAFHSTILRGLTTAQLDIIAAKNWKTN